MSARVPSSLARRARQARCLAAVGVSVVLLLLGSGVDAAQAPQQASRPAQAPAQPQTPASRAPATADATPLRDMWLVIYNVRPDKTADFEAVATRVRDALQRSTTPRRRQQAEGLRIHRSALPNPDGHVVYFVQIPTEPTSDVDRTGLDVLVDAVLPAEATALKQQLVGALDPRNPSGNTLMLAVR